MSELWFVQLPSGDVRAMTLEALDAAFQAGSIDESTLVREDGEIKWSTLADIAGMDGSESQDAAAPPPLPPEETPVAYAVTSPASPVSYAPAYVSQPYVSQPPPSYAPSSFAPSVRPVVSDLPDEDELMAFKPKKKRGVFVAVAAVGILAAAAFVAVRSSSLGQAPAAAAAPAAVEAPVAAIPITPSPSMGQPASTPLAFQPVDSAEPSSAGGKLSDSQKAALLDKDKHREQAHKARQSAAPRRSKPSTSKAPFHKGGHAGDPLNSAI